MCKKHSSASGLIRGHSVRLDSCIRDKVVEMNNEGLVTVASCCGHGLYPQTILMKDGFGRITVAGTDIVVPRTRNLYRYDEKGYPYIPEVRDSR